MRIIFLKILFLLNSFKLQREIKDLNSQMSHLKTSKGANQLNYKILGIFIKDFKSILSKTFARTSYLCNFLIGIKVFSIIKTT